LCYRERIGTGTIPERQSPKLVTVDNQRVRRDRQSLLEIRVSRALGGSLGPVNRTIRGPVGRLSQVEQQAP